MNMNSIIINSEEVKKGLIREIGAREFNVLIVIASFSDEFNESTISQREIAEVIGFSLPTVNKAIDKLLKTKINGVPIIKRRLSYDEIRNTFSVYILNTKIIKIV